MFHRSIEAETTRDILRAVFHSGAHFCVHEPLPAGGPFSDEGAANHTRFHTPSSALHLFVLGSQRVDSRKGTEAVPRPANSRGKPSGGPANRLKPEQCVFWQQEPEGIDAGHFTRMYWRSAIKTSCSCTKRLSSITSGCKRSFSAGLRVTSTSV